ncbi:hypothetical protein GGR01_000979 [Acetobacter oeni]|nr:hypothetical protein [Acetobacter oeni]
MFPGREGTAVVIFLSWRDMQSAARFFQRMMRVIFASMRYRLCGMLFPLQTEWGRIRTVCLPGCGIVLSRNRKMVVEWIVFGSISYAEAHGS